MIKYTEKLKSTDTEQLIEIAKSPQTYNEDFRLAALLELKQRSVLTDELDIILTKLEPHRTDTERKEGIRNAFFANGLPLSIKLATWFAFGVFTLEIINMLVFERHSYVGIGSVQIPGSTITFIVGVFLRTGKVWARNALFAVFVFSTLSFFILLQQMRLMGYLQQLFITISFALMFAKSAQSFYSRK